MHRTADLRRNPFEPSRLPDAAAAEQLGWRWELAVRLKDYLEQGEVAPLLDLASRAHTPADRAAGAVVAAATLME